MPQPKGFRGGHAPGHFRQALLDALDRGLAASGETGEDVLSFYSAAKQEWWKKLTGQQRTRWLLGHLFSCGDILPGNAARDLGDVLDKPVGTYAQACRGLIKELGLSGVR
jgi:hypothetical protein